MSIAAADINGDGNLDLVALSSSIVWVIAGNGDGTFRTPLFMFHALILPEAIVTGDFNGDGPLDIAVSDSYTVAVFPGKGDSTFGTPSFVATPESSGSPFAAGLEAINLSVDGRLDLVSLSRRSLTSLINITHR